MDIVAYGETYNRAMQGIEDMLLKEENPMASFKKERLSGSFSDICEQTSGDASCD